MSASLAIAFVAVQSACVCPGTHPLASGAGRAYAPSGTLYLGGRSGACMSERLGRRGCLMRPRAAPTTIHVTLYAQQTHYLAAVHRLAAAQLIPRGYAICQRRLGTIEEEARGRGAVE